MRSLPVWPAGFWSLMAGVVSACSVERVTFQRPFGGDAGADAPADASSCSAEICDGLDNDCSGTADDGAAIGSAQACAAASCVEIRDRNPASQSGLWWVAPGGRPPFQVYCDQVTDGGGWGLVWRNHGGAKGGEESNAALLARAAAGAGDPMVAPATATALASAIHQRMYDAYWSAPGREWIKLATLWNGADQVVNRQHIRVQLGTLTMASIFAAPVSACHAQPQKVRVTVNGNVAFGETDLINHYIAGSYGLANDGNGNQDSCGQPLANLISDPAPQKDSLYRIDGGDSTNAIRHLFSYSHGAAGRDASRCLYSCWEGMLTFYDAFVWAVR